MSVLIVTFIVTHILVWFVGYGMGTDSQIIACSSAAHRRKKKKNV